MRSVAAQVAVVSVEDLRELVRTAVVEALDDQQRASASDAQGLSCSGAAKLARRRRSAVAAAMAQGALKARRVGSSWRTTAGAVRAWIEAGCPEAR